MSYNTSFFLIIISIIFAMFFAFSFIDPTNLFKNKIDPMKIIIFLIKVIYYLMIVCTIFIILYCIIISIGLLGILSVIDIISSIISFILFLPFFIVVLIYSFYCFSLSESKQSIKYDELMRKYKENHNNDDINKIDNYKTLLFVIQDNFINSIHIIEPFKQWIKKFYYLRKNK